MLFKSLELENIRSYEHVKIDFLEGITLLAGDIGAGKSTILLAMEYALFGTRPDLTGDSLLRHGAQQGRIILKFTTDRTITVSRNLKRTSRGIDQVAGHLEIDGRRESLTARELKAKILDLLGYPEELLAKSKGLVYRYTVYTPQEDMKQILLENPEARMNTLTSVFGIDRYKMVSENAGLLLREIRTRQRELKAATQDLPSLRAEQAGIEVQTRQVMSKLKDVMSREEEAKQELASIKKAGLEIEEAYKKEQARRQALARVQAELAASEKNISQLITDIGYAARMIAEKREQVADPQDELKRNRQQLESCNEKQAHAKATLAMIENREAELRSPEHDLEGMEYCHVCKQKITPEHKEHVRKDIEDRLKTVAEKKEAASKNLLRTQKLAEQLRLEEAELLKQQEGYRDYQYFKERQKEAIQRKNSLEARKKEHEEEKENLSRRERELSTTSFDHESYDKHKRRHEDSEQSLNEIRVKKAALEAERAGMDRQVSSIKKRIEERQAQQMLMNTLQNREHWLNQVFLPVVDMIEKQVLSSIHQEFNRLFTEWLSALLEDDVIQARLSKTFTPVITQNGYDTSISNLSGGERTSVALSYRLALNSVINHHIRSIKTTDVIILDEPTDGFSNEQLGRVRDVLQQLPCRQVILVSHEQLMEGFVDRVIRVEKREHASSAA